MNKGIYRIAAGVGAAVILVSSATAQAATVTANGTPAPVASDSIAGWPAAPAVTSETAVLIDADTGAVLYDKGMDEYRYPASTTKIMTLLVAIENSSPKDIVTFTETGIRDVTWDSSNINAQLGETMTMKDCWMAAYIKSANEVCAQIAETVGGTEANFVEMMNQKAKELGCTHTHFANASGLPDENHYSSAHDLAKIMRACLRNKRFRQVMKCSNYKIPATNLSEARVMHTHMPLMAKESNLYYADCIGGKTGFSTDAQHTLVTAAERNGRTYIAVTMRAADLGINCTDSTSLFNYAFDNYKLENILEPEDVVKEINVADATKDTSNLKVSPENAIAAIIDKEQSVEELQPKIELDDNLSAPISAGEVVGKITYTIDNKNYSTNLVADTTVIKSGTWDILFKICVIILVLVILFMLLKPAKKSKKKRKKGGKSNYIGYKHLKI